MKKPGRFRVFLLALCFLLAGQAVSYAAFGRVETKRERLKKEANVPPPSSAGAASYEKIHESFLKEDYAAVDRLSREYLSGRPKSPQAEDVLYLDALSLLKLGRAPEARRKLEELESLSSLIETKAAASASIGDSYFYEGDSAAAYQSYQDTLRQYPGSDQSAYLLYKLFELSARLGKTGEAERFKARILSEYPASQEAKDAARFERPQPFTPSAPLQQVALEEHSFFTVQVGSFSQAKNARALMNKLIYRRYDAYVEMDGADKMCRVRVGKLTSRQEALALEACLKKEGYPTKICP